MIGSGFFFDFFQYFLFAALCIVLVLFAYSLVQNRTPNPPFSLVLYLLGACNVLSFGLSVRYACTRPAAMQSPLSAVLYAWQTYLLVRLILQARRGYADKRKIGRLATCLLISAAASEFLLPVLSYAVLWPFYSFDIMDILYGLLRLTPYIPCFVYLKYMLRPDAEADVLSV